MAKENPYKNIEREIIKQLEIAEDYTNGLFEGETIEKTLIAINKVVVLAGIESLLNSLPRNYAALPELRRRYEGLRT